MLLRSTSAPILNTWLPQHYSREYSPEKESQLQRRSRSLTIFSSSKSIDGQSGELLHQALSENKENVIKSRKQRRSSLDEPNYTKKILDPSSTFFVETLVAGGGGGIGSSGGKICNGGGNEDATDTYYKEMIQLNPGNSLLTGNYAKFLKEVRGDMKKAEEYCERAILGKTNDGNVLSLYADLLLHNHGDRIRAHSYFQQAVQMSPHDCYVQASYARFLWDVEEDEDEEEQIMSGENEHVPPTTIFPDFPKHTSITAPS